MDVQDFIVDAKFIQFDDFVPTLEYVLVEASSLTLAITFDFGLHAAIQFLKSSFDQGEAYRYTDIYTPASYNKRYLGSVTFGPGVSALWASYIGRKLNYGKQFLPEVVRSIPSKDAVYTFDGHYGDITLSRDPTNDRTIFFNKALDLNAIVHNAVGGHTVEGVPAQGLRQINLVKPKNNNINLASNDVIKISSSTNTYLTISLVGGANSSRTFAIPTLAS
jgi:hypothetical protein